MEIQFIYPLTINLLRPTKVFAKAGLDNHVSPDFANTQTLRLILADNSKVLKYFDKFQYDNVPNKKSKR